MNKNIERRWLEEAFESIGCAEHHIIVKRPLSLNEHDYIDNKKLANILYEYYERGHKESMERGNKRRGKKL